MREQLQSLRIAVLMGGVSREREVSLRSGNRVLESLLRQGFDAIGIDVDHHVAARLGSERVNFAFIALHGRHGEDGTIQGLLEILGIPYTGSGVLASALGMNKVATKRLLAGAGVATAPFALIDVDRGVDEEVRRIERELGLPLVVKPVSEGSSIGVHIADTSEALNRAVRSDLYYFGKIFVERFVRGREVSIGVLGTNGSSRALPVLELKPKNRFYDYEAKYTKGLTEFVLPADLTASTTLLVQEAAVTAHRALGCRGFSRVDAIVADDGTPFVLEVNTIPGLTELSDLPAQAAAAGMGFDELIFEILKTAYVENHPQRTTEHDERQVPIAPRDAGRPARIARLNASAAPGRHDRLAKAEPGLRRSAVQALRLTRHPHGPRHPRRRRVASHGILQPNRRIPFAPAIRLPTGLAEASPMSLAGNLSTMPLADLLQWIDSTRKTGHHGGRDRRVHDHAHDQGRSKIISSSSTDPKSYLGQFLLAHTRITEADLQRAFERQEKTRVYLGKNIYVKTLLGKILLEDGVLSERGDHARPPAQDRGDHLQPLHLRGRLVHLHPDELPPEELVPISLDVVEVLNRGIQRLEEWRNIRARIPSVNSRFRVLPTSCALPSWTSSRAPGRRRARGRAVRCTTSCSASTPPSSP